MASLFISTIQCHFYFFTTPQWQSFTEEKYKALKMYNSSILTFISGLQLCKWCPWRAAHLYSTDFPTSPPPPPYSVNARPYMIRLHYPLAYSTDFPSPPYSVVSTVSLSARPYMIISRTGKLNIMRFFASILAEIF